VSPEHPPAPAPDERVPPALAGAEVLSTHGERVRLADTWREGPVVLAFVRHFG